MPTTTIKPAKPASITVKLTESIEPRTYKIVATSNFQYGSLPIYADSSILALVKKRGTNDYLLIVKTEPTTHHRSINSALKYYAKDRGFKV